MTAAKPKISRVAILGWGSLIWCPGLLRLKSLWHRTGPVLPIEFARASLSERVTLVITPGAEEQTTLWALSHFEKRDKAIENLRKREGTRRRDIHWLTQEEQANGVTSEVASAIRGWLQGQEALDTVVWTGLPPKWGSDSERCPTPAEVVAYLEGLVAANRSARAEEYVRNTPSQIDTEIRRLLVNRLGWSHQPLSETLFAVADTEPTQNEDEPQRPSQ